MTMSWVAETTPTRTARAAMAPRLFEGSTPEMARSARMIIAWQASIQARLWPRVRVRPGMGTRSTRGAQRNFTE